MKSILALCCLMLISFEGKVMGQCTTPAGVPASGACPTTGTLVTSALSGTTLALGTTYYYTSATPLSLTSVTIKGTLYVCGNLSINTLNFSGTPAIVVEPGGSLTIYTGSIKGSITNYGTLSILDGSAQATINGQIANYGTLTFGDAGANIGTGIQGNNATGDLIYNGVGATFTVEGNSLNNTPITNMGQMFFNNNLNQQNSSICEGNDAVITVEQFNDDMTPGISLDAPADEAGLVVTTVLGGSSSNGILANSANVFICEATGITIGSPYLPGSATVETNCSSLNAVLPLILESFTADRGIDNTCTLTWTTVSEQGLLDFVLDSSTDARTFIPLATIPAHQTPSSYTYTTSLGATTWFRLRLNNTTGIAQIYSPVIEVEARNEKSTASKNFLRVLPSIVTNNTLQVQATLSSAQSGAWVVTDMRGRMVLKNQATLNQGTTNTFLSLPMLATGTYVLSLESGGATHVAPVRFVVIR